MGWEGWVGSQLAHFPHLQSATCHADIVPPGQSSIEENLSFLKTVMRYGGGGGVGKLASHVFFLGGLQRERSDGAVHYIRSERI